MWGFQSTQLNRVVRVGGEGGGEGFDAIIAGVGSVGKTIILDSSAYFPTTLVILFVIFSQFQKYFTDPYGIRDLRKF